MIYLHRVPLAMLRNEAHLVYAYFDHVLTNIFIKNSIYFIEIVRRYYRGPTLLFHILDPYTGSERTRPSGTRRSLNSLVNLSLVILYAVVLSALLITDSRLSNNVVGEEDNDADLSVTPLRLEINTDPLNLTNPHTDPPLGTSELDVQVSRPHKSLEQFKSLGPECLEQPKSLGPECLEQASLWAYKEPWANQVSRSLSLEQVKSLGL